MNIKVLLSLFVSLFALGCSGSKMVVMAPLGESAPALGQAGKPTLDKFVVGRWCTILPTLGGAEMDPDRYYDFKADGTFECGQKKGEWKSTGQWQLAGDQISLTYETMNGKPIAQHQEEYKKDEQGGGQVAVARALFYDQLYPQLEGMKQLFLDEDKKHLCFGRPEPAMQLPQVQGQSGETIDMNQLLKSTVAKLERMGEKKA